MKFTYQNGSRPLAGYTIKRGVGHGGFGEVYLAVSDRGKEVALKLICNHPEVELRGVGQCLNLNHPNLLYLHDITEDDRGRPWVVMQFIRGESLEDVIRSNPNGMPFDELLDWTRGIATGLAYLHESGIVHRDLKPANIFRDQGCVKIGDYGLSKFVATSQVGRQSVNIGSVHYMAPEISRGVYEHPLDVYGLGIILYEMLTGDVPFEGESYAEILVKHSQQRPDLTRIPESFRPIVEKALHKDPQERYCNGREFLEALPLAVDSHGNPIFADGSLSGAAYVHATRQASNQNGNMPEGNSAQDRRAENIRIEVVEEEEPLLAWVRSATYNLAEQWNAAKLHPVLKVCLLLAAIMGVLASSGVLFPLAFLATVAYFVYRGIRAVALSSPQKRPQRVPPVAPPIRTPPHGRPDYHERHEERLRRARASKHALRRTTRWEKPEPPPKSLRQRITELTGSMLLVALIVLLMGVVMMALRGELMQPEQFAWLSVVSILGSWAVMIPAKCWEGRPGDHVPRRFIMLGVGLAVGAAAFGLQNYLHASLTYNPAFAMPSREWLPDKFYTHDGNPKLLMYFAYFGFLMFLLRWWKMADAHRDTRLSLFGTVWCVFVAWALNYFWYFPQPWGCMVAASMAVAIQLAGPWQPLKKSLTRA